MEAQMKLTEKARAVLEAAAAHQDNVANDSGIGARGIAHALWGNCTMPMRAGQYAGKLINQRWLWRRMCWYRGAHGHEVYSHTEYYITQEGRAAIGQPRRGDTALAAAQAREHLSNKRKEKTNGNRTSNQRK
jgi:hypothetical protein